MSARSMINAWLFVLANGGSVLIASHWPNPTFTVGLVWGLGVIAGFLYLISDSRGH